MLSSVERLRMGLLVGAGLLLTVIGGFLGYAHYRTHRIIRDLPGRLGATITKEFGSYTYSQSLQGKTVFTIHAAQAIQHKDGNYTLHDVNMVMYGRKGDRADHIAGSQFEYDQKTGMVHAVGVVHLDLEAPPANSPLPGESVAGMSTPSAAGPPGAGQVGKRAASQSVAGEKAGGKPSAVAAGKDGAANDRVIHITTSGLVYSQKSNVAQTDQEIEFSFAGLTGRALGAEYDSNTGHVVLRAAVEVSGLERGQPVLLRATHAELDRQTELATLENARYSSAGEAAAADEGRVHLRPDGSAERIDGDRHVRLEQAGEGVVTSDHVDVTLTAQSKPEVAILTGAVHYADDEALRQARGDAEQATLHFDGQGRVEHVALAGNKAGDKARGTGGGRVRSTERVAGANANAPWSVRNLSAETVELQLGPDAAGRSELREATAVGAARLTSVAPAAVGTAAGAKGQAGAGMTTAGMTTTKLSGDRLQAHFVAAHGQSEVSTVHGTGHTVLEQIAATGVDQVSAGDTLEVNFREAAAGGGKATGGKSGGKTAGTSGQASGSSMGSVEVANAVQQGNVAISRTVPASAMAKGTAGAASTASAAPDVQHAIAQRATYDGDANLFTLSGGVQVTDAQSVLWANRVTMEQQTGDATAEGEVKVTYLQAGSSAQAGSSSQPDANAQPVHVLAARAELEHAAGRATFYGNAAGTGPGLARMWQSGEPGEGGSQVEAPVLIFEQAQKRLTARGAAGGAAMAVHTVLVSAAHGGVLPVGGVKKTATPRNGAREPGPQVSGPQVIRVSSREMVYSDAAREAEFTGGVRVLDADGDLRAQQATVYLQPTRSGSGAGAGSGATPRPAKSSAAGTPPVGVLGGEMDHIVATGKVEILQPGRRATGERLVYTASDQMFVLTGTKSAPPKVVDAQQGTATGASLRFHSGDDSVVISGDGEGSSGQKPRTETKVKE
jgi:lipopolysaccharide export system protein LptA